jgi:hypothetical protein
MHASHLKERVSRVSGHFHSHLLECRELVSDHVALICNHAEQERHQQSAMPPAEAEGVHGNATWHGGRHFADTDPAIFAFVGSVEIESMTA